MNAGTVMNYTTQASFKGLPIDFKNGFWKEMTNYVLWFVLEDLLKQMLNDHILLF